MREEGGVCGAGLSGGCSSGKGRGGVGLNRPGCFQCRWEDLTLCTVLPESQLGELCLALVPGQGDAVGAGGKDCSHLPGQREPLSPERREKMECC